MKIRAIGEWVLACSLALSAQATARDWYTLSIDDQRVGYAYRDSVNENDATIDTQYSLVAVTQQRAITRVEGKITTLRNSRNQIQKIDVVTSTGLRRDSWSGDFDWSRNKLTRRIASRSDRATVSLAPQLRFSDEQFSYFAPLLAGKMADLEYDYLDPSLALPTKMRATVVKDQSALTPDSVHIRLTTKNESATSRSAAQDVWLDRRGQVLRLEQAFLGRVLRWTPCTTACDASVATPFDPVASMIVRSPFHVPANAINGPIRYFITSKDGTAIQLPNTGEQLVTTNSHSTVMTICKDCGSEAATSEADIARYLRPNNWVQSNAKEIRSFARRSVASNGTTHRRMVGLAEAVRNHMTGAVDFLGYSSATDALRTRSGDCTEFAVLLAAAARAENIPTRVVFGLVYADRFSGKKNVFSPHAWVQAWDGKRWVSYDAALETFDATHIAIAVGEGRPEEYEAAAKLLPQWKIEKLGLVKKAT